MMMSVEGDDHVFKLDLSSHTSLEEDDDDEVFHVYMAVVDTFIIL